eukprot:Pompholyxophrys_sp_v1_NODE_32_length_3580_cov_3.984118.p1 type:complete len:837 gc:universal NODE_32_length_3580_cov_3.984118:2543-33(-)
MDILFPHNVPLPDDVYVDFAEVDETPWNLKQKDKFFPFKTDSEKYFAEFFERNKVSATEVDKFLADNRKNGFVSNLFYQNANEIEAIYSRAVDEWKTLDILSEFPGCQRDKLEVKFKNGWDMLKCMFSSTDPQKMSFHYREISKNGERAYGPLNSGNWWKNEQRFVPTGACVMPYILFSDKTQVSIKGHVQLHPVYLQLGNVNKEFRTVDSAIQLVAMVPIVMKADFPNLSKSDFRQVCRTIWHRLYELILAPIEVISRRGSWLKDSEGELHWMWPRMAFAVYDWEERNIANMSYGNANCMRPCGVCLCPQEKLSDLSGYKYPLRTPDYMEYILHTASQMMNRHGQILQGRELLKRASLHGRPCFANLDGCNIYIMANVDPLHHIRSKGLIWRLVDFSQSYISRELRGHPTMIEELLQQIDLYLAKVPCFPHMRVFKNGIFELPPLSGSEYERLLMQLPFALINVLPGSPLVKPAVDLLKWYINSCRKIHTESTLILLEEQKVAIGNSWNIFRHPEISPSSLNMPKYHDLEHVILPIILWGDQSQRDSSVAEHAHIKKIKKNWARSNKRLEHSINYIARKNNVDLARSIFNNKSVFPQKVNLHNHLTTRSIDIVGLNAFNDSNFCLRFFGLRQLKELKLSLSQFFDSNIELCFTQESIRNVHGSAEFMLPSDENIRVYSSCWIDQPFSALKWRVVSSKSFHGKPRHDIIEVWRDNQMILGKLCLLFKCKPPFCAKASKLLSLAFVQWFVPASACPLISTPRYVLSENMEVIDIASIYSHQWLLPEASSELWHNNVFIQQLLEAKNDSTVDEDSFTTNQNNETDCLHQSLFHYFDLW